MPAVYGIPRLRGEYYFGQLRSPFSQGSPPLARGVRVDRQVCHFVVGITPACAGSTAIIRPTIRGHWDHPRLRGEYPAYPSIPDPVSGSPPLARGVHPGRRCCCRLPGITPACAGSTFTLSSIKSPVRDHPRLRGEYVNEDLSGYLLLGSPPLARGVLCFIRFQGVDRGITPACAGSTFPVHPSDTSQWDHPRLRGEYLLALSHTVREQGSPPLARGVPCFHTSFAIYRGITPACAGSTSSSGTGNAFRRDHPRLRGEYNADECTRLGIPGSPPLARGVL